MHFFLGALRVKEILSSSRSECIIEISFIVFQPKHMLWVLKRTVSMILIIIIIGFLINMQVQGHHPHQWAPFQVNWLAACIADLTSDLQNAQQSGNSTRGSRVPSVSSMSAWASLAPTSFNMYITCHSHRAA